MGTSRPHRVHEHTDPPHLLGLLRAQPAVRPSSDRKDSTPRFGGRLLRCRISTQRKTAQGHSRPIQLLAPGS